MEQQHAIGKLLLEVQLPSREEAFALQGTLSNRCTAELEPMLSALLDSWADPDTLLQIDKLEIDLGSCNLEALRNSLPEMIISHLRQHYQGIKTQLTLEAGMQRIPLIQGYYESWLYFLERGVLPSSAVKWQPEEWETGILAALSSETYALQQCKVLFMEHPYAIRRLVLQFSPAFVQNWILAFSADAYRQVLQLISEWETFIYHPQLREAAGALAPAQQLIPVLPARTNYHDDVFVWLIREIIVPGRTMSNAALLQQLIQQMANSAKEELTPRMLYVLQNVNTGAVKAPVFLQLTASTLAMQYVAEIIALQKELFTVQQEGERHKQGEKRDREDSVQRRKNDVAKDATEQQEQGSSRKSREQEQQDEKARRGKTAEEIRSDKTSSVKENTAAEGSMQEAEEEVEGSTGVQKPVNSDPGASSKQGASSSAEENTAAPEAPAAGSVYYINNAGLILLHPYLSFCFDALELRDGQQFKDEAAKHKAVQLLGYLAYGEEEIPEYDLVLPKILCGIQPAEPVRRFIPLTDAEKAEANELLAAVISHWNALGNTSPDGLRGNFLLREGKLEWKEEEWQLYVTQQAYDMLLNRLPWGFSVVGLSWMPWLIKTVWT